MANRATEGSENVLFKIFAPLTDVKVTVVVEVVLVELNAESNGPALPSETLLEKYLKEIIKGFSVDDKGGVSLSVVDQMRSNQVSQLTFQQQIMFSVKPATRELKTSVLEAMNGAISEAKSSPSGEKSPLRISRIDVDEAISPYAPENSGNYKLFILYRGDGEKYIYDHGASSGSRISVEDGNTNPKVTLPSNCGYMGWVGERKRYAWLDLGAHVDPGWGPNHGAFGIVSSSTLPKISKISRDGWMCLKLAAIVHRTAHQLLVPSLLYEPGGIQSTLPSSTGDISRENVLVHIHILCTVEPCLEAEKRAWETSLEPLLQEPSRDPDRGDLLPAVKVTATSMLLFNHPLLATGLHQSYRAGSKIEPGGSDRMVLVAAELRHWLRLQFREEFGRDRGVDEGNESLRVVPLFVLSLDSDQDIAFDDWTRSVAFADMVISVKSRAARISSAFKCGGRAVELPGNSGGGSRADKKDAGSDGLLRETFASLAQLIWGVSPRELSWDPLRGAIGTDYLWATGASIHTPLSSHGSLTFNERDAYLRARILLNVDAALREARDALSEAAAMQPVMSLTLGEREIKSVLQLKDELTHSLEEFAAHHHSNAIQHTRNSKMRVVELKKLLLEYSKGELRLSCSCGQPGGGPNDQQILTSKVIDFFFVAISLLTCVVLVQRCLSGRLSSVSGKHKRS